MNILIEYPKCSTCKRARKFLDEHKIPYTTRNIVENHPTQQELQELIDKSGYPIKKFFNTSGLKYKELNLKEKLKEMSPEEQIELLATDGMLVKRPLFIKEDKILVGFKEKEWE